MESGHKPLTRSLIDVSILLGYPRILLGGSKPNIFAMGAKTNLHKTLPMELRRSTPRDIVGVLQLQVASFIACTDKGDWSWQLQSNRY